MVKRALVFGLMILLAGPVLAGEYKWSGKSNDFGGIVTYAIENPTIEGRESGYLDLHCGGFNRSIMISFTADYDVTGDDRHYAVFDIDGDLFTRSGSLGQGGLFMGTPIIELDKNDPLVAALVAGQQLKIYVGRETKKYPDFEAGLDGSAQAILKHLSVCLSQ